MIVGEVRKVEPDGDGVKLLLAMNPKLIKDVPKGVTAQLIPKTLFGEKYVALIPPTQDDGEIAARPATRSPRPTCRSRSRRCSTTSTRCSTRSTRPTSPTR